MSRLVSVERLAVEARDPAGKAVRILDGVDLTIAPGEVVAAIGASGSGKSTLGLALSGFTRPGARIVSGRILFERQNILDLPASALRRLRGRDIAYVPQSAAAAFNPALTIDAQVAESPLLRGELSGDTARTRGAELYEDLGLPDPTNIGQRYPHQVSGGQLQRAAAAMALAGAPKLVVFDEPTTSLDVTTQVGVLAAFRERIRARDIAALYISHDLAVVAQLADRIVVMAAGRIIDAGKTQTILARHVPIELPTKRASRPANDGRPLLAVEHLRFRYRRAPQDAVADVGLTIGHAEVVGLIGESGSGKSTLARLIAGLHKPDAGVIRFDGAPLPPLVRRRSPELRRAIQIVFQSADTALNPRQRAAEILGRPLAFLRGLRGAERAAEVTRLLDLVELPPAMADRFPGQLSGGQKQRLNLARALAAAPDLMICDEVTSALDAPLRRTIVELLRRLRDRHGLAILFVTHDLSTAADFADRIAVMQNGRIVEAGPTEDVLTRPTHPYTADLIRAVPQPNPGWLDMALADRAAARHDPTGARPVRSNAL